MIGALLSMRLVGKKPWLQSLGFWIIILILSMALSIVSVKLWVMVTLLSILVFVLVAHYGFKLAWVHSVVVWFVSFIIDLIIIYVLLLVYPNILSFWYMPIGG